MGPGELNISVVIATYTEERWQHLVHAVQSIRQQTLRVCEIIVVVDGNPDLLGRIRRELPDVVATENLQQPGSSGAHNTGIGMARGEFVAFLDDDATAAPDWLERLGEHVSKRETLAVGGRVLPIWQHAKPRWFPMEFAWVIGCSYTGMPHRAEAVRNVWTCLCARREYLVHAGGFRDELARVGTLPTGGDETELCIRMTAKMPQGRIMYEPQACINHFVPLSRTRWSYFLKRCYQEGKSKSLIARHVGTHTGLRTERSYVIHILPRAVLKGLSDTLLHGDVFGLARAGAVFAGLITTIMGYLAPKPHISRTAAVSTIISKTDLLVPELAPEQDNYL